jgi:formate transporter FocA
VGAAAPTFDALIPPAMAAKAADVGESKAGMAVVPMFVLAVLAGAFIALGAMFSTVVTAGSADVPFGLARLVGGVAFSLGLILVVVAGAELFTGNNLIVMAWAERRIPVFRVLRNWAIVYAGNLVGAVATAGLVFFSKQYAFGDGKVGAQALTIAETKGGLGFGQAILLGVLCNVLVCLAVWLCYSARTVTDKILAIVFPITAFVAAGFEHSIANMYFLPIAVFIRDGAGDAFWSKAGVSPGDFPHVGWGDAVSNIVPVTLGNVFGGAVMVGLVYWLIYRRRVAS